MHFSIGDFLGVLFYLIIVLGIGVFSGRNIKGEKDFYLGGKTLPWYLILFSIVATETSSLTFLSVPGISYSTDLAFLQIAFGFLIGRFIVAYWILPLYQKGEYSSVYQWVGENLGIATQKSVSAIFLITRVLADGVRLFVTSIPLALLFKEAFHGRLSDTQIGVLALFLIAAFTIIYTVSGGFKAVVVTDSIQFWVYLLGGVFAIGYLLSNLLSLYSPVQLIDYARQNQKLIIYHGTQGSFWQSPYYLLNAILGGMFITIGSHGIDQLIAQRTLACKNDREGRMAMIGSGFFVIIQFALFLSIGVLLYIHYRGATIGKDQVFAKYILETIPPPFTGFILAAILASAMSTLSSSINSLSLSTRVDLLKRSEQQSLSSSRNWSIIWGLILFLSSLIPYVLSGMIKDSLVELGLKISSFTFGPMLGIFLTIYWQKKRTYRLQAKALLMALFFSLFSIITVTFLVQPAFAFIIPGGSLLFFLYLIIGQWIWQKKKTV